MGFYIGVTFDTKKDVQEFRNYVNNLINDEEWKEDIIETADLRDDLSFSFTESDKQDYIELGNTFPIQAFKYDDNADITKEQYFLNCAFREYILNEKFYEYDFTNISDYSVAFDIWMQINDYYTDSRMTVEEVIAESKHKKVTKKDKSFMLI